MEFAARIPFVEAQGFELLRFADGQAEVALTMRPDQTNSFSVLHGGVAMTLLDVAMAHAARSPVAGHERDPRGVVTVEMKTSFMRPAEGRLTARATLLHRSTTMAFCEGSVFDAEQRLCAHATGTFKYLRKLPTQGRRVKPLRHPEDAQP